MPLPDHAMNTILRPCRVPWAISPSTSGVTLTHSESDVEPDCTAVFGGWRLQENGRKDNLRIDIAFRLCYYARIGPYPDTEDVEFLGYRVLRNHSPAPGDYVAWLDEQWRTTGICPESGFYVATESEWLRSLPSGYREGFNHYVIFGRDGHVELIARGFRWRAWMWLGGLREDTASTGAPVAEGEEVE